MMATCPPSPTGSRSRPADHRTPSTSGTHQRRRPLRFLLVGVVNTALGLAAYPVLLWITRSWSMHYLLVLPLAQALCIVSAFLLHKHLVFRTQGGYRREFAWFLSFHLAQSAANLVVLPLLVELGGLHPAWAQTLYAVLTMAGSWFWYSRVAFNSRGSRLP